MQTEESKQTQKDKFNEISKKSLVHVQYSCSGNFNGINDEEYIPIVNTKRITENAENEDKTKNS